MSSVSPVLQQVEQYRVLLERQDAQALGRLIDAYRRAYSRLADKVDLLLLEIGDKAPTAGQIFRMARYKDLLDQANEHERNETANSIRRRWFEILARRTKDHPKTIVRKILTEDDITEAASEVGLFN